MNSEDEQLAEALRASLATFEDEKRRRGNEKCSTTNDEMLALKLHEQLNRDGNDGNQGSSYSYSHGEPSQHHGSSYQRHQQQFDFPKISKSISKRDRRIVLLGMTGSGKSSTGNSIVRGNVFKASARASSETFYCQHASVMLQGRNVLVVDTPGLFDTRQNNDDTMREITRCVALSAPGPHAFILVVEGGNRASAQTQNCAKMILEVFGKQAIRHMIVLFTRLDDITYDGDDLKTFVKSLPPNMKEVLTKCNNRYTAFNNRHVSDQMKAAQVNELMTIVDGVVAQNDDRCFTNDVYKDFEKMIVARERKIKEKYEMERKMMSDEIKKEFEKQKQAQKEDIEREKRKRLEEEAQYRAQLKNLEDRYNQQIQRLNEQQMEMERKRKEQEENERERRNIQLERERNDREQEIERARRNKELEIERERRNEQQRIIQRLEEQKRAQEEKTKQEERKRREAEAKYRADMEELDRRHNQKEQEVRQEVRREIQRDKEGSGGFFNTLKKGLVKAAKFAGKILMSVLF